MTKYRLLTLSLIYLLIVAGFIGVGSDPGSNQQVPAGTLLWSFRIPILDPHERYGDSSLVPALGADGTLYVNAKLDLFALTPDEGKLKWVVRTEASSGSSIAVGPEGTIYTASYFGGILAVNPDGSPRWALPLLAELVLPSPLAIGADGTIYIKALGCTRHVCDSKFFAVNPNGTEKWALRMFANSPLIGPDGTIYIEGTAVCTSQEADCPPGFGVLRPRGPRGLFALTPQGEVKWVAPLPTESPFGVPPAIGADGTIYVPLQSEDQLVAVSPTGSIKWIFNDPVVRASVSSPVIGVDGTIYLILGPDYSSGLLYALTPSGQLKWSFQEDLICTLGSLGPIALTPAVGADGTIYVGTCDNQLDAINPDGSLKWRFQVPTPGLLYGIVGGILVGDGVVYFLSNQVHGDLTGDVVLYAVTSSSPGLAHSSWPMFQHDPQHTGRARTP